MLNKNRTTEDMIEYHPNGRMSYEFKTNSNEISHECTYDEKGNALTFKNSNGYYEVQDKQVTKEEYDAFILSLEKLKEEPKKEPMKTQMQELIYEIQYWKEKAPIGSAFRDCLIILEGSAINKLEKEKKQIMDAHINGQSEFDILEYRGINMSLAEQYYNQTYNQNK